MEGLEPEIAAQRIADMRFSSTMKKASDFRDRNKVRELAKKLDQANMPVPIRRGPPGKWEPQTYSEVAEKPTSFEYNRIFGSRNGVLVGDLYK
jgi:hypothetical protein